MSSEHLALDHALIAVADLDEAERWCRSQLGIGCVPGGEFADGVVTRVIPLGGVQYVELLTVQHITHTSAELQTAIENGGGCIDWAVSTVDIQAVAARLNRPIGRGSITLANGSTASWAYVENDRGTGLPFFVQYDQPDGRHALWAERYSSARHRDKPTGIRGIRTPATGERLHAWLAGADLPVMPGRPALDVMLAFADGTTKEFSDVR